MERSVRDSDSVAVESSSGLAFRHGKLDQTAKQFGLLRSSDSIRTRTPFSDPPRQLAVCEGPSSVQVLLSSFRFRALALSHPASHRLGTRTFPNGCYAIYPEFDGSNSRSKRPVSCHAQETFTELLVRGHRLPIRSPPETSLWGGNLCESSPP